MSDDSQTTRRDKSEQSDKFIPPPMDPYATYQTPYERRQAPEPNPFIEFRRFADKQLSDIMSGFSSFANIPKMFGMDEEMKTFREQLEKDLKKDFEALAAHAQTLRETGGSVNHTRKTLDPAAAAAAAATQSLMDHQKYAQEKLAESNRKFAEAMENPMRDENWIITTDEKGRRFRINPHAPDDAVLLLPFTPAAPMTEQPEDPKVRWKRGFRNCPELKKYQGETELDVYEAMEDQQRSSNSAEPSPGARPWGSWLSAYGYDGIQKSKKASEATTSEPDSKVQKDNTVRSCIPQTYRAFQAKRMDPLRNDHEFLPWLILSQYSPLYLANPEWVGVRSAKLHNGCQGGCAEPMHIYSHRHQSASITEEDDKLRAGLANKVAWADAFEDLLSLEKTGKMPNREAEGRVHPRNMTSSWIRDMIEKGLLGPKWWVENGEIRRDSRDDPRTNFPIVPSEDLSEMRQKLKERTREIRQKFGYSQEDIERARSEIQAILPGIMTLWDEDPLAPIDAEGLKRLQRKNREWDQLSMGNTSTSQQAAPETNDAPTQSDSRNKSPIPSQTSSSEVAIPVQAQQQPSPTPTSAPASVPAPAPTVSVISTLTTVTSRTLSDGSVETKRVLKKRFADGMEESEESTEVVHPQVPASKLGKIVSDDQKKQGWFWT